MKHILCVNAVLGTVGFLLGWLRYGSAQMGAIFGIGYFVVMTLGWILTVWPSEGQTG
jgi:hypothetical protein